MTNKQIKRKSESERQDMCMCVFRYLVFHTGSFQWWIVRW